jgi:aspartate-semialdehyde dehydrogenase
MGNSGATVAVLGATGAVGKQLLETLESVKSVGDIVPVASRASSETSVSFRDSSIELVQLSNEALLEVDVAISALPGNMGKSPLEGLQEQGVPIIDLSGVFGNAVPFVIPGLRGEVRQIRESGVISIPSPVAIALSRIIKALSSFGVQDVTGSAIYPAGIAGAKGIRELSSQVVSVFNSQEPSRAIFSDGLAFDLLPSWGAVGDKGWSGHELMIALQTALISGVDPTRIAVDLVVAPLFAGMGISLRVGLAPGWELSDAIAAVNDATGLELSRKPMPRKTIGESSIQVGRLRSDLSGSSLHLWIALDPQHLAATTAVDALVELLEGEA